MQGVNRKVLICCVRKAEREYAGLLYLREYVTLTHVWKSCQGVEQPLQLRRKVKLITLFTFTTLDRQAVQVNTNLLLLFPNLAFGP